MGAPAIPESVRAMLRSQSNCALILSGGYDFRGARRPRLQPSHSGLLDPRGTNTVLNEPGVRDISTWSVMPW